MSINSAIDVAGGIGSLADACGVKYQAIQRWRRQNIVPIERCADIERATGGRVRCEELRPDVEWDRGADGAVTAYRVRLGQAPAATDERAA